MSKFSGKHDLYNQIRDASDEDFAAGKYRIYMNHADHSREIAIRSRKDIIPFYPFSAENWYREDDGTQNIYLYEYSHIDYEERILIKNYRNMLRSIYRRKEENGETFDSVKAARKVTHGGQDFKTALKIARGIEKNS